MSRAFHEGLSSLMRSRSSALEHLTSPNVMVDLFQARRAEILADGLVLKHCSAKVLKNRLGSRYVIAYRLTFGDGKSGKQRFMELVGKSYADGAESDKTFQTMLMLWKGGFGEGERLNIPKPVCYFPELKFILQERARGVRLSSHLGRNDQVSLAHVRMAARWLTKLHGLKVAPAGLCSYEEDKTSLRIFVDELGAKYPYLASRLRELASRVRQKLASLQSTPLTTVHGDYHPENIFVGKGKVTVIDFDRVCLSDPAKDLGYSVAQMRAMAYFSSGSLEAANQDIRTFLDEYFNALSPAKRKPLAQRITPFVAHAAVESMYYILCVVQAEDPHVISTWPDEIERFANAEEVEDMHAWPKRRARK